MELLCHLVNIIREIRDLQNSQNVAYMTSHYANDAEKLRVFSTTIVPTLKENAIGNLEISVPQEMHRKKVLTNIRRDIMYTSTYHLISHFLFIRECYKNVNINKL